MIGEVRFHCVETTSTNDLARAAAVQNIAEGAVFTADHQTAGRGRRGARWTAAAGDSVLMSVVLYPDGSVSDAWRLGWIACLAVIDALKAFGMDAQCKWPNDVLVNGNKIAGLLIETVPTVNNAYAAIVGIGVNVDQQSFDTGIDYRVPPTSVRLELSCDVPSISDLIDQICLSLDRYYSGYDGNWESVVTTYSKVLIAGQVQTGTDPVTGDVVSGTLLDVRAEDGAARLLTEGAELRFVFPDIAVRA